MAPKRVPIGDPPSASSDEESEEISDKEDEQTQEQSKENPESEEEEESSEDEDEDEEENVKPSSVQKPNPTIQKPNRTVAPQPQSDSDSEGSDSETLPSPTASDFTVKPIVSKPMADSTNKPTKPTLKAPSSGAKRPVEGEKSEKESRKKIKVSNGDLEEKKNPIQRLWSENDEIVILKGLIDYQSKKGADPNADMGAFHDFIKELLHVEVSRNQLMDKVRRLKKKYRNNVEKGEKGEDPVFFKPHEHKSFELSKKIWSGGEKKTVDSANNSNKKARKSVNVKVSNSVLLPLGGKDGKEVALDEGLKGEVQDMKVDKEEFWSMYPRLKESLELEESSYLAMSVPGKSFMKERMTTIGSATAKELEEKWTNLCVEEVSLYMKRADLIKEQAKAVLDAMKDSKC